MVLYSRTYNTFDMVSKLESESILSIHQRTIQNFMDIIILKRLESNAPISGYGIIKYIQEKFHVLPSAGTVYSLIYSLERKNLIEGNETCRKRVYRITEQGEELLRKINQSNAQFHAVFSRIFSDS
jgi:DNA-binding PadR family transcriptional regulator